MSVMTDTKTLCEPLLATSLEAGRAVMEIYNAEFEVSVKSDNSPVTAADTASEDIILKALNVVAPQIPVLSEEAFSEGHIPEVGDEFFLVDPLDGTREFINRNGEFTINIALIQYGRPVFGIVYAPALDQMFYASAPGEAYEASLTPGGPAPQPIAANGIRIKTREPASDGIAAVASRSHMTAETQQKLERFRITSTINAGSSLKFCLVARGDADLYPRLGRTMEWDTAAGQAVLTAAGGAVLTMEGAPLAYGKSERGFDNPGFMAWGRQPG